MLTAKLVASVFGAGRGDGALVGMPLIPAAALADGVTAAARGVGRLWRLARQTAAAVLRDVAELLDPAPVASERAPVAYARVPLPLVEAPAVEEAPVILPLVMPSAAQVTTEEAPAVLPIRPAVESVEAAAVAQHGSVRKAAKALGVAESTLRSRLKKQRR